MKLFDEDVAMSSHEWLLFLEERPELDVRAPPCDGRFYTIILADRTCICEVNMWNLLVPDVLMLTGPEDSSR
jgi:hypothetical protein